MFFKLYFYNLAKNQFNKIIDLNINIHFNISDEFKLYTLFYNFDYLII